MTIAKLDGTANDSPVDEIDAGLGIALLGQKPGVGMPGCLLCFPESVIHSEQVYR